MTKIPRLKLEEDLIKFYNLLPDTPTDVLIDYLIDKNRIEEVDILKFDQHSWAINPNNYFCEFCRMGISNDDIRAKQPCRLARDYIRVQRDRINLTEIEEYSHLWCERIEKLLRRQRLRALKNKYPNLKPFLNFCICNQTILISKVENRPISCHNCGYSLKTKNHVENSTGCENCSFCIQCLKFIYTDSFKKFLVKNIFDPGFSYMRLINTYHKFTVPPNSEKIKILSNTSVEYENDTYSLVGMDNHNYCVYVSSKSNNVLFISNCEQNIFGFRKN